ncbi:MAG: ROK family protein [Trebonia sp.]
MRYPPEEDRIAPGSHGDVLALVSGGRAATIADVSELTALVRSTVKRRIDDLTAGGYLKGDTEPDADGKTTGRPARRIRLNDRNLVLAVDLGASHCRTAVMRVTQEIVAEDEVPIETTSLTREELLTRLVPHLRGLLCRADGEGTLRAIGMGVPAPIEFDSGKPSNPPILGSGWHGFSIKDFLTERFGGVEAVVDNDVNVMALGEHRRHRPGERDLLLVKIGTGIGCGIITGGRLHRGAQGCAGDIGHIQVPGGDRHRCRCGMTGCLEAAAGGTAIARALSAAGHPAATPADVIRLADDGDPDAFRELQRAGQQIGSVLAAVVNFFNPQTIAVAGALSRSPHLIARIREVVSQRSLPLATGLIIEPARAAEQAAVTGAGILAIEQFLSPGRINRQFSDSPRNISGRDQQLA